MNVVPIRLAPGSHFRFLPMLNTISIPIHVMESWDNGQRNDSPAAMSDHQSGPDSVAKTLMSRRSHRKSRLGCGNCKRRRIKCDETKPECVNCTKHELRCDYVTGILGQMVVTTTPLSPSAEPPKRKRGRPRKLHPPANAFAATTPQQTPQTNVEASTPSIGDVTSPNPTEVSENDLVDLELMHYFSIHGHGNMFGSQALTHYWKTYVPRLGFQNPYVLHLVLGYAALALARFRPAQRDHYFSHSERHYEIGVRKATALLPHLNNENAEPLYVAISIIAIYAMAKGPRPGEYLLFGEHGSAEWLPLFRGVNSIIGLAYDTISAGELAIMFKYRGVRHYQDEPRPPPEHWRERLKEFGDFVQASADPNLETYMVEFDRLNDSYIAVWGTEEERKKNPYMSSIFAWIYRTSNNFILCLQQKQPIGLLIFAYLGVLMTSLDQEHHWATNGWPEHIVAGVYSFLPHEYHPWLEWHIKCVGWTPGTSTTP
ncbi:hypothetical protein IWZ01DRAFT_35016 [Phyllosticta capitalensis]